MKTENELRSEMKPDLMKLHMDATVWTQRATKNVIVIPV